MSKESKTPASGQPRYGEVVQRLEEVVKRLEGGDLSLEDSLKAFEEGIGLVRKGEKLLGDAEKRVEQLLAEDGEDKAAPLDLPATFDGKASPNLAKPSSVAEGDEEDVPF